MTDQTPITPPPPPAPPASYPAAPAPAGAAAPPLPPVPPPPAAGAGGNRGGGSKKFIIGGIAAALVLGGGFGAYAVYDKLDGGGAQPHDVLPSSMQAYLRVDLDPSAGQKVDLLRLIRKVPDLADEAGITSDKQDLRELVFGDVLESECDNIDYDKDVKPWLGDRVGVGANIEDEKFLVAVQTTDEDKSRAGLKKLFACSNEEYGIAYLDGYAILAPKQAEVDAAIKATEKSSLGDNKDFTDDFDELGNQGIASGWADLKAIAKVPSVKEALGEQASELAKSGSVATALRADGSAIELAVLGGLTETSAKATELGKLPADTVAAMSIAGVGDQVTEGFDSFVKEFDSQFSGLVPPAPTPDPLTVPDPTATPDPLATPDPAATPGLDDDLSLDDGSDFDNDFGTDDPSTPPGPSGAQGYIDEIERETGFKLPEDLATLFGDSLTLAIGGDNLETLPSMSGPDAFSSLNIALALKSDKAAALDLVKRIASAASGAGIPLVADETDDGAVLATNQDAADEIADPDGSLSDEKAFKSVFPDGDSSYGGFYLNIGAILDKVLKADPPADVRKGIKSASALSAVGISATQKDDDRTLTRMRLSFR
jgi:hypothetical protein